MHFALESGKPYNQSINNVAKDYLLEILSRTMSAGARALRNSDYASPEKKKELLKLNLRCWELISKVVLFLSPVLAKQGSASFEGTRFVLTGEFSSLGPTERFDLIFRSIPGNIINWYLDDLYSPKMGPLLYSQMNSEISDLSKYFLANVIISKRPYGWKSKIENYIANIHKNSYYLYGTESTLHFEHKLVSFRKHQQKKIYSPLEKWLGLSIRQELKSPTKS